MLPLAGRSADGHPVWPAKFIDARIADVVSQDCRRNWARHRTAPEPSPLVPSIFLQGIFFMTNTFEPTVVGYMGIVIEDLACGARTMHRTIISTPELVQRA